MNEMKSKLPDRKDITKCRGEDCGEEIVFLNTDKPGTKIPVNVWVKKNDQGLRAPQAGETQYIRGTHQPHHITCVNADDFRNNGRR